MRRKKKEPVDAVKDVSLQNPRDDLSSKTNQIRSDKNLAASINQHGTLGACA
jgi:hypothetical protein